MFCCVCVLRLRGRQVWGKNIPVKFLKIKLNKNHWLFEKFRTALDLPRMAGSQRAPEYHTAHIFLIVSLLSSIFDCSMGHRAHSLSSHGSIEHLSSSRANISIFKLQFTLHSLFLNFCLMCLSRLQDPVQIPYRVQLSHFLRLPVTMAAS